MMAYACENAFGDAPTCKLKVSKVILQQPIDRIQVEKLLTQKKTDLLRGFVSQRTRRKFSAFLVVDPTGKTSFEFEPRPEGSKSKKPFVKRGAPEVTTTDANGKTETRSVVPKNIIKKGGARKRATKKSPPGE
jgi:DNA topoisomerase-3